MATLVAVERPVLEGSGEGIVVGVGVDVGVDEDPVMAAVVDVVLSDDDIEEDEESEVVELMEEELEDVEELVDVEDEELDTVGCVFVIPGVYGVTSRVPHLL